MPSSHARALALALALVGCVDAPSAEIAATPTPAILFAPFHAEGTIWVTPSNGPEPSRHEVPFSVNETGRDVTVGVRVGERYFVGELPTTSAQYTVQILDAAGEVLAEASRNPGEGTEMTLSVEGAAMGDHVFVALVRGGSDGSANGDYFDYVIDVA